MGRATTVWAAKWRQFNRLDGRREHLLRETPGDPHPIIFPTRARARRWIRENYGYIADRPDLQAEPHGWRLPLPVRVRITVEEIP